MSAGLDAARPVTTAAKVRTPAAVPVKTPNRNEEASQTKKRPPHGSQVCESRSGVGERINHALRLKEMTKNSEPDVSESEDESHDESQSEAGENTGKIDTGFHTDYRPAKIMRRKGPIRADPRIAPTITKRSSCRLLM
jgi:hypothetical protein